MKLLLSSLMLLLSATVGAHAAEIRADKVVRMEASENRLQVDLSDGEVLEVQLPFSAGAKPRAVISAQGRIYNGECKVLKLVNEKPALRVFVQLAATEGDDGWNGCTATIDPGMGGNSSNLLHVDFGQMILEE